MNNYDELIATLSNDLQKVRPAANIDRVALTWLLGCALYVVGITHFMGPIRPTALFQLMTETRFLMETLSGVLAITAITLIAFRSAIPGALNPRLVKWGLALIIVWLSFYLVGLKSPALEPSMLGKRDYCVWETLVYALPPMLLAFFLTRRFYALQPVRTAMYFSLAAGMLPALYMQMACMYDPAHILKFHLLPGFLVMTVGALIAWLVPTRHGNHTRRSSALHQLRK